MCSWIEISLSLHLASRVLNLSLIHSIVLLDLQSIFVSASATHDLPRITSFAIRSTMYGRTVMLASPTCVNRFLLHCCIATSIPSRSLAFRLLLSLWSFSLSVNCSEATFSPNPPSFKTIQGKLAALSLGTFTCKLEATTILSDYMEKIYTLFCEFSHYFL